MGLTSKERERKEEGMGKGRREGECLTSTRWGIKGPGVWYQLAGGGDALRLGR